MRFRWTLAALGVAALLSAAMGYIRLSERVPPVDTQAPLHYFIAREQFARDELRCEFTLGLDRRRLYDVWSLPLQPCRLGHGRSVPTTRGVMAYAKRAEVEFFVDHTDWTHVLLRADVAHRRLAQRPLLRRFDPRIGPRNRLQRFFHRSLRLGGNAHCDVLVGIIEELNAVVPPRKIGVRTQRLID